MPRKNQNDRKDRRMFSGWGPVTDGHLCNVMTGRSIKTKSEAIRIIVREASQQVDRARETTTEADAVGA